MDLKEIKQIIDLMKRSDLTEFSVEEQNFKLKIRREGAAPQIVMSGPPPAPPAHPQPALSPAHPPPAAAPADEPGIAYIKSPMVGTFYSSSSPESPPFTEVNQRVEESSIVCIIEAMKIMNEIQAEIRGVVLEILVENGQPVEYGQRLFRVKTN
ncbi:MAG: acetyl-CoA carboxylase biotin carboxyl carrier protein [Opitutaceae bacterium]